MRVFLDDERTTPEGWVRVYWPAEAIALLEAGGVEELSLDHDLGNDERGTGYDVVLWVEDAVVTRGFKPPRISVHSANSSAREKMLSGIRSIELHAHRSMARELVERRVIPTHVDGLRVVEFAILPEKVLPKGYQPPTDGQTPLQPIDVMVIVVSERVDDDEPVYWVRCLNDASEVVAGHMYYSIAGARRFPVEEYGVGDVPWRPV